MALNFTIFDEFVNFIVWPHFLVYLLYFNVKYWSFTIARFIFWKISDDHFSFFCVLTCGWFCCCCCNCCGRANNLLKKFIEYNLKFDRWLIKLLLGREEGVIERHRYDYRSDEVSNGKPFAPTYIRNKQLSTTEVTILSTLVFTFGLLIGITAFDAYFLNVSYACTDDRSFSCFVLPVDVNANKSELGITNERIDSCSPWENTNISDHVYVVCYKWIYNFKGVTVATGALLSLFQLTIKAVTSIFISINAYLCNHSNCFTRENLKNIRQILAGAVFAIECGISFTFTILYFAGDGYNTTVRYLNEHGNQILIISGIITTCLLLPIEEYIEDPPIKRVDKGCQVDERTASGQYQNLINYASV